MGGRAAPGTSSRPGAGGWDGDPAADPTGRGEYDPETGLWDWYDRDPEDRAPVGEAYQLSRLIKQWKVIEADFASEYGIRLALVRDSMSFREFATLLGGLLSADTRLWRVLNPDRQEAAGE